MLSISKIGSPGGAANYYTKEDYARVGTLDLTDETAPIEIETVEGVLTYYAVPEDELGTPLFWDGEGAKALGLEGAINDADFKCVLYGLNPDPEGEAISKIEMALREEAEADRLLRAEESKGQEVDPQHTPSDRNVAIPDVKPEPCLSDTQSAWAVLSPEERIKAAQSHHETHVAGWDLTFSAPKSVSIAALDERGDARLQDAHRLAVDTALAYVEQHFSVYRVRDADRERRDEISGNLLMARTTHTLSRAGDPNLHDHVIVLNATKDEHGQWRALESEHIYKHMKLAGAIYQAQLRNLAQDLGHDVRDGETLNTFEIASVTATAIAMHSQRNTQIKTHMAQMEEVKGRKLSHVEKEAAVLKDRPQKVRLSREELQARWSEHHERVGFDVGVIGMAAQKFQKGRDVSFAKPTGFQNALALVKDFFSGDGPAFQSPQSALAYGQEAAFHRSTIATQHEILFQAIIANGNRLPLKDYLDTGYFERKEFIVADKKVLSGLTTHDTIERERAINAHIQRKYGTARGFDPDLVASGLSGEALSKFGLTLNLTPDQYRAVHVALASKDGVVAIQGFAGTGKTTAYEAMQNIYASLTAMSLTSHDLRPKERPLKLILSNEQRLDDFHQITAGLKGVAPTHAAVKELSEKNIQAATLSSILMRYAFGKTQAPQSLAKMRQDFKGATMVLDEASMLGNRQLEAVFAMQDDLKIEKIILSGDIRQIASLQAGAPFKMGMAHNDHMEKADLTTIMRQNANPTLKDAVIAFAEGKSSEAMKRLQPFIHELGRGAKDEDIADKAFTLWKDNGASAKVVVDTNNMRASMNARIRNELKIKGALSQDSFSQQTYSDVGLSNYDKMTSRLYQQGQTLYFYAKTQKFKVGDTLTITGLNHQRNIIEGRGSDGKTVRMDIKRSFQKNAEASYGVYQRTVCEFAVGERVVFNKTDKTKGIKTNDEYQIIGFDDKVVRLKSHKDKPQELIVPRNDPQLSFMTYAYAVTADKAQGKSFESVVAVLKSAGQGSFVNHARAYIMASRAKEGLNLVTDSFRDLMRKVAEHDGINLVGLDNLKIQTQKNHSPDNNYSGPKAAQLSSGELVRKADKLASDQENSKAQLKGEGLIEKENISDVIAQTYDDNKDSRFKNKSYDMGM